MNWKEMKQCMMTVGGVRVGDELRTCYAILYRPHEEVKYHVITDFDESGQNPYTLNMFTPAQAAPVFDVGEIKDYPMVDEQEMRELEQYCGKPVRDRFSGRVFKLFGFLIEPNRKTGRFVAKALVEDSAVLSTRIIGMLAGADE